MYRAKCTWCISLLKNMNELKNSYFCKDKEDIYIEVNDEEVAELIEQMNKSQQETFRLHNELLTLIEK